MRFIKAGLLVVLMISMVDASPRSRRARRRRAAQARQVQTNRSSQYRYTTPTQTRTATQTRTPATTTQPALSTWYTTPGRTVTPQAGSVTSVTRQPTLAAATTMVASNAQVVQGSLPSVPVPASSVPITGQVSPASVVTPAKADSVEKRTTVLKPVVEEVAKTTGTPTLAEAAPEVSTQPVDLPVVDSSFEDASYPAPVPDAMPMVESAKSLTLQEPYCASCRVIPAGQTFSSALAELNGIRARKGLPALIEDPSLSAIAHQKASKQAQAGAMFHPGGTMGGARYEGVGMGPQFTSCYQDITGATYAGAATVVGRNGQRYHCLLVK